MSIDKILGVMTTALVSPKLAADFIADMRTKLSEMGSGDRNAENADLNHKTAESRFKDDWNLEVQFYASNTLDILIAVDPDTDEATVVLEFNPRTKERGKNFLAGFTKHKSLERAVRHGWNLYSTAVNVIYNLNKAAAAEEEKMAKAKEAAEKKAASDAAKAKEREAKAAEKAAKATKATEKAAKATGKQKPGKDAFADLAEPKATNGSKKPAKAPTKPTPTKGEAKASKGRKVPQPSAN